MLIGIITQMSKLVRIPFFTHSWFVRSIPPSIHGPRGDVLRQLPQGPPCP